MTPIIDIVFLLIIFFMLVCQFIVAENFEVSVPDECGYAQDKKDKSENFATVSIVFGDDGGVNYAVGSELIEADGGGDVAGRIAGAIDKVLEHDERKVVCIRADRDMSYAMSQYALAGVAMSSATDVQLAVFKEKSPR